MRPLVLFSNDDGIDSPLLRGLVTALAPHVEALVIAPERQRSAASHAITLHKPLRLLEIAPGMFSLSGTPVDCVYLGCLKLAKRLPDMIVSGINDGYNLGTDVFYSGTAAAAIEGALRGSVGVAISMAPKADAARAIAFSAGLVQALLASKPKPATVFNVNIPAGELTGYEWTVLGRRRYEDDVHERQDPRGRSYYWIGGGPAGHDDLQHSDCNAVHEGLASVTTMHLDLTDRGSWEQPPIAVDAVPGFAQRRRPR